MSGRSTVAGLDLAEYMTVPSSSASSGDQDCP